MRLLLSYLRRHWPLVIVALALASINQVFSLLDPAIFRHVIDDYVTKAGDYTVATSRLRRRRRQAVRADGRRRVRVADREELPGLFPQRHHPARRRAAVRRRRSPFAVRPLRRLRGSAERRDARQAAEGARRRREVHQRVRERGLRDRHRHHLRDGVLVPHSLGDRAGVLPDRAAARHPQLVHEPARQDDPEADRARDDGAGGRDDRVAAEHRAAQEPRPRRPGDHAAQQHDGEDPRARAEEGPLHPHA